MQTRNQINHSYCLYSVTISGSFILGLLLLWIFPKPELFIMMNSFHTPFLDGFFKMITFLGDGWFSIIVGAWLIFTGKRILGSKVLIVYAVSGIFAQLCKSFIIMPRPRAIIPENIFPHYIPGYTLNAWNSFPSGHTASVFALTAILAWSSPVRPLRFILAVAAILTGFSRIYLGQHFLDDVLSGAFLGVLTAYGVMTFTDRNLSLKQSRDR